MNSTNTSKLSNPTSLTNYLIHLILFGVFILCYYDTFLWLYYKYNYLDSYYSHGYLIPFVSAYLVYTQRNRLKAIKPSSAISGLILIISALIIHIVAVMSDINFISGFSMFFFILGCSLYLFGREITKILAFPIGFLLFMFPIPGSFIDIVGLPTKFIATEIGLKIIDITGIPNYREGFRIFLPNAEMFVGTPCNGMKSLISFAALGVLVLYFIKFAVWKRILFLLLIYPLAAILNGGRIALLCLIADKYGIEKASPESYLHDLSGMVVFIAGILILFLVIKLWDAKKQK